MQILHTLVLIPLLLPLSLTQTSKVNTTLTLKVDAPYPLPATGRVFYLTKHAPSESATADATNQDQKFSTAETQVCNFDANYAFMVNNQTEYQQTSSMMAILRNNAGVPEDAFVVVWQSSADGSGLGIFASIFNLISDEHEVTPTIEKFQINSESIFGKLIPEFRHLNSW
jgi:hypothetical protein